MKMMMMTSMDQCQLCCSILINTTGIRITTRSTLWPYLYDKNIRETLMPTSEGSKSGVTDDEVKGLPKLTFTFSFEGIPPPCADNDLDDERTLVGYECLDKLQCLQFLHEKLEGCKKQISGVVNRIKTLCKNSTPTNVENSIFRKHRRRIPIWREETTKHGTADVWWAGTSVGKEDISEVLRSLASLCEVVSRDEGKTQKCDTIRDARIQTSTDLAQDPIIVQKSFPIKTIVPTDAGVLPGSSNVTKTNALPEAEPPSTVIIAPQTEVEEDIGDVFTHIIKLEPGPTVNSVDDRSPNLDASSIKQDPLPEEDPVPPATADPPPSNSKTVLRSFINKRLDLMADSREVTDGPNANPSAVQGPHEETGEGHEDVVEHARYPCEFCDKRFVQKIKLMTHRCSRTRKTVQQQ